MLVLVDVDDTLIHVESANLPIRPGARIIRVGERRVQLQVRPSAEPFLRALGQAGCVVAAATNGERGVQQELLRLVGLDRLLVGVIGVAQTLALPAVPWVLVDNEDPIYAGLLGKLSRLGADPEAPGFWARHYLQCQDWLGQGDHEPLDGLVPEVLARLGRQS